MVPPALLILQILATLATGQLDSEYDYEAAPIEEEEAVPFKDYIPIQGENGRKFLEGLVVEAGKRTLFPELYTPEIERTSVEPYNRRELPNINKSPKFYEINGQPEYEEVYTNRRIRSGVLNCPDDCSVYKPICGSDGKVYPSKITLQKDLGQSAVENITYVHLTVWILTILYVHQMEGFIIIFAS
ncbi:UNVERIFIED_CONTAM: hypothetical protein NCL1_37746 [Trichonephila clavipes]